MAAALLYVALLAAIAARQGAWGVSGERVLQETVWREGVRGWRAEQNCYHFFTIQWWGDPQMREPPGGVLRMCQFWSPVTLLWGGAQGAQGVFQLPSAACPPSFGGPYNDTFQELQAVSDDASFATAGFAWAPPCAPGSYWLTSQAPGACEAGERAAAGAVGREGGEAGGERGGGAANAEGPSQSLGVVLQVDVVEGQPLYPDQSPLKLAPRQQRMQQQRDALGGKALPAPARQALLRQRRAAPPRARAFFSDGGEAAPRGGSRDASVAAEQSGGAYAGRLGAGARGGARDAPGWKRRWTVVALCFFAFMLCNMDRVNMSIAILPISQQYGWTSTTVVGGVWADRFGGKLVLGFGVVWWSLATVLTPLAAQASLPALLVVRACMGVGEGVAMPAMNNLLSKWVPVKERSRSLSLVYSGMYSGSTLGLALSPHMISHWGWPSVFYVFGVAGVAWFLLWQRRAASSPAADPGISAAEAGYIARNTAAGPANVASIPWRRLLSKAPVWALIVSHFCHNWGTFILLTYMPTYYTQVLGMDLKSSGFYSVLPWLTMAVAANVGGWIADSLIERGWSVTHVMQTIGFLGPAFFLTQLGRIDSVARAVACMMACQGLDAFSQSGLYSNHGDIGPRYAGVLLGLSNTAGVLAGVLGTAATGFILQHGSWDQVWGVAVALYLVGTAVWNIFATGERVFD
eukprot:scaffold5.g918.t1